jgi:hypothetical protein
MRLHREKGGPHSGKDQKFKTKRNFLEMRPKANLRETFCVLEIGLELTI